MDNIKTNILFLSTLFYTSVYFLYTIPTRLTYFIFNIKKCSAFSYIPNNLPKIN